MTDTQHGAAAEEQAAAIDQQVRTVTDRLCNRHPEIAGPVRGALDSARTRLRRAHARCGRADAAAWADHRADLDRGLAELDVELARVHEGAGRDGPSLDAVLLETTASMELRAWQLHLRTADDASGRYLAAGVEQNLHTLRAAAGTPDDTPARALVEDSLEALRRDMGRAAD